MREIVQVKKELESVEPASSKATAKLEKKLLNLRVDLNYLLVKCLSNIEALYHYLRAGPALSKTREVHRSIPRRNGWQRSSYQR